jgi:hypothetical protein
VAGFVNDMMTEHEMCAPTGRFPVLCHGQVPSLFQAEHLKVSIRLTSGNGGLPRFLERNVVGSFEAFDSEPEESRLALSRLVRKNLTVKTEGQSAILRR